MSVIAQLVIEIARLDIINKKFLCNGQIKQYYNYLCQIKKGPSGYAFKPHHVIAVVQ